jgi:hypothetical protein
MQAGAIRRVANVQAGSLAHGFKTFKDLDAAFAVSRTLGCVVSGLGGLFCVVARRDRFTHKFF